MALADAAVNDGGTCLWGEVEQAQRVAHRDAALANLAGHRLVREPKSIDQLAIGERSLDGVQVLPLEVLDEGQLERAFVSLRLAHDGRNRLQAGELGRPQSTLAGDELIPAVRELADDDRLNHTVDRDRRRELAQRLLVEGRPWLVRVPGDPVKGDLEQAASRIPPRDERVEAAAEAEWSRAARCAASHGPPPCPRAHGTHR